MKLGLVLSGGGSKGSYEVGAINALLELGFSFDIVTGTSIGALNGALVAQHQVNRLNTLWNTIEPSNIFKNDITQIKLSFNLDEIVQNKNLLTSFFKDYTKEIGADITPFYDLIHSYLDFDKLQQSNINFGCVSVEFPSLKPVFTQKNDYKTPDDAFNHLLASASCFPAFPKASFNDKKYIDGGYYDNLPIQYCFKLGADNVIAIDLKQNPQHPVYLRHPLVKTIVPSWDLGSFLDFNKSHIQRNKRLGYLDVMKAYHHLYGFKYAFKHLPTPSIFKQYAKALLKYDMIEEINLMQQNYSTVLADYDYGIIALEQLMDWFNYDPTHIYDLDELCSDIKEYYQTLNDQTVDRSTFEELVNNLNMNEVYLLVLKHMVQHKDFCVDLGLASKIISNQLLPLHYVSLFVLMVIEI